MSHSASCQDVSQMVDSKVHHFCGFLVHIGKGWRGGCGLEVSLEGVLAEWSGRSAPDSWENGALWNGLERRMWPRDGSGGSAGGMAWKKCTIFAGIWCTLVGGGEERRGKAGEVGSGGEGREQERVGGDGGRMGVEGVRRGGGRAVAGSGGRKQRQELAGGGRWQGWGQRTRAASSMMRSAKLSR